MRAVDQPPSSVAAGTQLTGLKAEENHQLAKSLKFIGHEMPRRHHGDGIWRSGDRLHAHRPEPPVQLEPDPVDVVNDDVVGSTLPPPYHELQPELGDDVNDDVPPYYENASSEACSDVRTEAAHARAEPPLIPRPPPSYSESRNHPTAPSVFHERRLHTTLPQSGTNQHSGAGPRAVTIADKRCIVSCSMLQHVSLHAAWHVAGYRYMANAIVAGYF